VENIENPEQVFAFRLRQLRGKKKQAQIAELLDIPLRTYVNLEQGAVLPHPDNRKKIADFYGVKETFLFLDPDLAEPNPEQIASALATALAEPAFSVQLVAMVRGILEHGRSNKKSRDP
jgi:transcriptional regulator with XRE-family HTH domain